MSNLTCVQYPVTADQGSRNQVPDIQFSSFWSLMDVLGRIEEADSVEVQSDSLGSVLTKQESVAAAHVQAARYSVEDNSWSTMV